MKYATELGMYVIIDWHILSDGNPKQNQEWHFLKNIILVGTPVWSQEVYLTDGGMESVILLILWQERKRYEADVLIRLTGM